MTFQTASKASAACSVSGSDCTINGLTQIGAGRVLTFNSAQRLTADMLVSTNGLMEDYGIWAGLDGLQPAHGPIDCRLARFDLTMLLGMHGIRIHKHTNLVLGDANLSLPGFNFAGRVKYNSPYRGAAITLKEGSNAKVIRVWTDGPVGVGPNQAEFGNAGWEQLRTDGTLFSGCEFNVQDRFFALGAGAINTRMENSVIRASGLCVPEHRRAVESLAGGDGRVRQRAVFRIGIMRTRAIKPYLVRVHVHQLHAEWAAAVGAGRRHRIAGARQQSRRRSGETFPRRGYDHMRVCG